MTTATEHLASVAPPRRFRLADPSMILWLAMIAVLVFLIASPMARLVISSFQEPESGRLTLANYVAAYANARHLQALLRAATGVVGQTVFAQLCREINLAGDTLDDIPDRRTLRQLIETLEKAAGTIQASAKCNGDHGEPPSRQNAARRNPVGAARADLIREAQRVGTLRGMRVSDVIDRAAKGEFRFAELQRLTVESLPALIAATDILRHVTPEPVEEGNPAILIYSGADPSTSR